MNFHPSTNSVQNRYAIGVGCVEGDDNLEQNLMLQICHRHVECPHEFT